MYSVIIPTLGYCNEIMLLSLVTLSAADSVEEIILINNSGVYIEVGDCEKIKQVVLPKNIFVNPSWNLGVNLANNTSEWLIFLNDDVMLPANVFDFLSTKVFDGYSLVGARGETIQAFCKSNPFVQEEIYILDAFDGRKWGFGICMFVEKVSYVPIPSDLKIWCGDDYLYQEIRRGGKRGTAGGHIGRDDRVGLTRHNDRCHRDG